MNKDADRKEGGKGNTSSRVSNRPHECALRPVCAGGTEAPVRCSFSPYGGGCGELVS